MSMTNDVVHFEIIGRNPTELQNYYSNLFGWSPTVGSPVSAKISQPDSYGFLSPGQSAPPVAGGIGGGPGFVPHTLFYVHVDDVETYLAKAARLGGERVLGPELSPDGLTIGHFRDPEGNLVGLAKTP
jgi:predicted enzyme related to lactoylglutathione lyase